MTDEKQGPETHVERPGAKAKAFNAAMATFGIAVVVFIIGVVVGFPISTFGVEFVTENSGLVFGLLFGLLVIVLVIAAALMIFRRQIWESLFKRGEVEMERFARPLSEVARYAAMQKVAEATESARDLAELVLARYAWVSTRRWLMATITAFIAAIAALAGSALLFQQNQLLRTQIGLMGDQNSRIEEQNRFIQSQIELGEAQRSTAIVPEIVEIGAQIAQEIAGINTYAGDIPSIAMLSAGLKARIIAATIAARPYRYLRNPLTDIDDILIANSGLARRTDLNASIELRQQLAAAGNDVDFTGVQGGVMTDRPLSPERGQIIALLIVNNLTDFNQLIGADFSFAEVQATATGTSIDFSSGSLQFSNFDRQLLVGASFRGAFLDHARFRRASVNYVDFSVGTLGSLSGGPSLTRPTRLSGTDFTGAVIKNVNYNGSQGFGINFDTALLHNVTFNDAQIAGGTFRNSLFGMVDFTGADVKSVDFDQAIVFDPAFLDQIEKQAKPDSFDKTRFAIAAIPTEEFAKHPRWAEAWLDGLEEKQAYRITRVGAFD